MQLLLVSATTNEINPTLQWLQTLPAGTVDVLITGIGSTATSYHLTKRLQSSRPDIVLQAGIGGSFQQAYPPGSLVGIAEEVMADLGVMEHGEIVDIFDMGFAASDEKPFVGRWLPNPSIYKYNYKLNWVRGATVNNISASPAQVSAIVRKYDPTIESMEGAAFHYVCLLETIPFLQLRAVSNFAGERNKANWKFAEAITNLNRQLQLIITDLLKQ